MWHPVKQYTVYVYIFSTLLDIGGLMWLIGRCFVYGRKYGNKRQTTREACTQMEEDKYYDHAKMLKVLTLFVKEKLFSPFSSVITNIRANFKMWSSTCPCVDHGCHVPASMTWQFFGTAVFHQTLSEWAPALSRGGLWVVHAVLQRITDQGAVTSKHYDLGHWSVCNLPWGD